MARHEVAFDVPKRPLGRAQTMCALQKKWPVPIDPLAMRVHERVINLATQPH